MIAGIVLYTFTPYLLVYMNTSNESYGEFLGKKNLNLKIGSIDNTPDTDTPDTDTKSFEKYIFMDCRSIQQTRRVMRLVLYEHVTGKTNIC